VNRVVIATTLGWLISCLWLSYLIQNLTNFTGLMKMRIWQWIIKWRS